MSNKKALRVTLQVFSLLLLITGLFMLFVNQLKITGSVFAYEVVLFGGTKHSVDFKAAVPSTLAYFLMPVGGVFGLASTVVNKKGLSICLAACGLLVTALCVAGVFMTGFFFKAANLAYCSDRAIQILAGPILGGIFSSIALVCQGLALPLAE